MRILWRVYVVALLAAIASAITEKCNSLLDGQLLIGTEGTIWRVNPHDKYNREAHISSDSPIRLAYSYSRHTLYYSDLTSRKVYALKDKSSKSRVFASPEPGQRWLPWSIAVDDVNGKLYVAESFASSLLAYDLTSGDSFAVVIGTNVSQPKDVEIDADDGHLFLLDKHQILKAELDGSNPTVIHEEFVQLPVDNNGRAVLVRNPISVADLTLDVASKRVYWVDTLKRTVESSDYNGENRQVHFTDDSGVPGDYETLASLTFASGAVYWADDVTRKLFRIDEGADEPRVILDGLEIHAITAVACESRPKAANPCATPDGHPCEQLCLPSKSSPTGYRCACKIGLELAHDGRTCDFAQDFLLFTQDAYLRGQSLTGRAGKDVIEPSRVYVGEVSRIDFDASTNVVYYSSAFPNDRLHEVRLRDSRSRILQPDFLSNSSGDIAYDWTTGNLYYLTYYYADATTLSVLNVHDPTHSKLLIRNVPRLVRGLVVHPNQGYVFFARLDDQERGQPSRGSISRLASDGSGLKVIVDLGDVGSADALAVDFEENRIYWTEMTTPGKLAVRHADLDGQDVLEVKLPANTLTDVSELTISDKYIYAIGNVESLLLRVDKDGANPVTIVRGEQPGSLGDVKVFSRSLQTTRSDHPCKTNKCQEFCFAVPSAESTGSLEATCGCSYGEKLANDGLTCLDNSTDEPAFVPCKYTSFKCNMSTAAE